MKTIIITLASLFIITGMCIYFSMPTQVTKEVSVMRDVTDSELAQPNANQIIPLFGLSDNKWNGAQFHFQDISNVSFNQVVEVSIPSGNEWLSNEFNRDKDIKTFYGQIAQTITDSTKEKIGRTHSSVYLPIANELNRLSQSSAKRRVLILYTDLMENDINFSFYNKATFTLLKKNPEKILDHFKSEQPINRLDGIEVYLIYQPKDACTDLQYQVVSNVYKTMLTALGAKVTITANLAN
ncbi:MAG TPA: hypothetical protein VK808_02400 [Bacteroidia bacterium]|jgi:hypothetical protein|nr:hypothetical protein [Bacteroidia bacterium]